MFGRVFLAIKSKTNRVTVVAGLAYLLGKEVVHLRLKGQ